MTKTKQRELFRKIGMAILATAMLIGIGVRFPKAHAGELCGGTVDKKCEPVPVPCPYQRCG